MASRELNDNGVNDAWSPGGESDQGIRTKSPVASQRIDDRTERSVSAKSMAAHY
jgi:hypothetical protein